MSTTTEQEFINDDPTAGTTITDPDAPANPDAPTDPAPEVPNHSSTDCAGNCPQHP